MSLDKTKGIVIKFLVIFPNQEIVVVFCTSRNDHFTTQTNINQSFFMIGSRDNRNNRDFSSN